MPSTCPRPPAGQSAGAQDTLAAGGEADARGSGAAPGGQSSGAPDWAPASGAVPQCPTPPLPPRHGHTLSGGSSGGSALPPGLPLAGAPAADSSGGSGTLAAQAAAARRSSNALSELGAGVQSPGSASRCGLASVEANLPS